MKDAGLRNDVEAEIQKTIISRGLLKDYKLQG
jgi:hypothetical protein